MMWITAVPTVVVQAHVTMMLRLEAEAKIAMSNAMALGGGNMEPEDARRVGQALVLQASGEPAPAAPGRSAVNPAALQAAHGIPVRRVPWQPKIVVTDGD